MGAGRAEGGGGGSERGQLKELCDHGARSHGSIGGMGVEGHGARVVRYGSRVLGVRGEERPGGIGPWGPLGGRGAWGQAMGLPWRRPRSGWGRRLVVQGI